MSNSYEKRRSAVGEKVYLDFDKRVTNEHLDDRLQKDRLIIAAETAHEMPFVTMPFRESGIILPGERNTHILHAFQPNLWAQDYAHGVGELGKMNVGTAIERADSSATYTLETSESIRNTLKRVGKSVYEFYEAVRQAAMIESAYYTRLGGGEMAENERKKIDVALMSRTVNNTPLFQSVLRSVGVAESDKLGLLQFSDEMDLTKILSDFVVSDPYYRRREGLISKFTEINSTESAALNQTRTGRFKEALLMQIGRKDPAMVERVLRALQSEVV